MTAIRKLSHACYTTPDLDAQVEYYTEVLGLGLVERTADAVYLGGKIDPHSVVLTKGADATCDALAFQVEPDGDLGEFEAKIKAHGVDVKRESDPQPGISDALVFEDFKGTQIQVFAQATPTDHAFTHKGITPHKLGHIAFHVKDVQAATQWYVDVLGFRVSDWMGDFFSFLRCSKDHHTINLVGTGGNQHFHTAFELNDWAHMQTALDYLSQRGIKTLWGPGRHGIGHNLFSYHKGPNGLITELFAEVDQVNEEMGYFEPRPWHRDNPQKPKVWPKGPDSANFWGPPPPEDFLAL